MPKAKSYGGFRIMWVVVMFDLPTGTRSERKHYTRFRKRLVEQGYVMLQYSVYGRPCPSDENAQMHVKRVQAALPPVEGQVRVLTLTDHQFGRMQIFQGKRPQNPEQPPDQLTFFFD